MTKTTKTLITIAISILAGCTGWFVGHDSPMLAIEIMIILVIIQYKIVSNKANKAN